jgi:5-methylcytosine-specific restriction endonuclease McrA
MEITNELRNNQETINESNNFQNNIINGFQIAQNSFSMTPFLTNSINMITGFSTKSKEIISDYLDIILSDSFKINSFNNRTKLYFRKIQLEIFLRWKKTTSNDYNEDIMEFNNLVSKYQVNYSNYIDLFQIISLLCNINNESILEIIPFYEKLLKKYEEYDKLKNKLNSKNSKKDESKKDESKKDESKKDDKEKKVKKPKEKIPASVKNTLWSQNFPNVLEGKCKCCQTEVISRNNFDCGHIISEKEGGKIHLDNLKPICRSCNSSMGTQNMTDYMKKYGFDKISK